MSDDVRAEAWHRGGVSALTNLEAWVRGSGDCTLHADDIARYRAQHFPALPSPPFGFTHEDVTELRGAAREWETSDGLLKTGLILESIAARIAALLPPEPTP